MSSSRREDGVAIFSPSNNPKRERVLHSIFSPSYHAKINRLNTSRDYTLESIPEKQPSKSPVPLHFHSSPPKFSEGGVVVGFVEKDILFSPQQPTNFSPLSANSNSFDTLQTIDMLNFNFVKDCESIKDLQRVVKILEETNESPMLLTEATKRLEEIGQKSNTLDSPFNVYLSSCAANISRIEDANITKDSLDPSKSSLNLSISPQSMLRGVTFVKTPLECDAKNQAFFAKKKKVSFECDKEVLSNEVRQLSQKALDLDASRTKEQDSFVRKLGELETAKKDAELLVGGLKERIELSDCRTKELEDSIQVMREKHKNTQEELLKERNILKKRGEEANSIERELQQKIEYLRSELKKSEQRSRLISGAEKGLRLKQEKELSTQQQKNEELNLLLKEAYQNLESMKRRQTLFRMAIFRSMGISASEWKNMASRDLQDELTAKITEMRAQNKAMAKSQKEQLKSSEECQRLNEQLQRTMQAKEKLQDQNIELSKKLQDLAKEVSSSRAYIDKLLKTSHETHQSDWEKREEQYKKVIQGLRQQIRKQTSSVSVDVYKSALADGKKNTENLKRAQQKIAKLVEKVNKMEKEKSIEISHGIDTPKNKDAFATFALSPIEKGLLKNKSFPVDETPARPTESKSIIFENNKSPKLSQNELIGIDVIIPVDVTEKMQESSVKASIKSKQKESTRKAKFVSWDKRINKEVFLKAEARRRKKNAKCGDEAKSINLGVDENKAPGNKESLLLESSTLKCKSKSSTPMKKARQAGGRKALQDKLRRMRSPPLKARQALGSLRIN